MRELVDYGIRITHLPCYEHANQNYHEDYHYIIKVMKQYYGLNPHPYLECSLKDGLPKVSS